MTPDQLDDLSAAIVTEREAHAAADRAQAKALLARVDLEALLRVPVHEGMGTLEDLWAVERQISGFKEAMAIWGQGISMTDTGMPARDWRHSLAEVRRCYRFGVEIQNVHVFSDPSRVTATTGRIGEASVYLLCGDLVEAVMTWTPHAVIARRAALLRT